MNKHIQAGLRKVGVLVATATASGLALAQTAPAGPDMTPLTSNISFGTVTAAVLAVAGLLAVVYVAVKGAQIALSMLKR